VEPAGVQVDEMIPGLPRPLQGAELPGTDAAARLPQLWDVQHHPLALVIEQQQSDRIARQVRCLEPKRMWRVGCRPEGEKGPRVTFHHLAHVAQAVFGLDEEVTRLVVYRADRGVAVAEWPPVQGKPAAAPEVGGADWRPGGHLLVGKGVWPG